MISLVAGKREREGKVMARVTQGERGRDYRTRAGGGREEEEASFTPPYFPSPQIHCSVEKERGRTEGESGPVVKVGGACLRPPPSPERLLKRRGEEAIRRTGGGGKRKMGQLFCQKEREGSQKYSTILQGSQSDLEHCNFFWA